MGTKTQKLSNVVDQIVEWQSVFTGDGSTGLTAVAGRGYFINTTSGTVTVTLPASPKIGDIVQLKDYARTWGTNNVTTASTLVDGVTTSSTFSTNGQTVTLVYMDGTKGWSLVNEDTTSTLVPANFIAATGGTVTTSGDFKIHTFTGDGCFVISQIGNAPINPLGGPSVVDYLVVAGGGSNGPGHVGGGGGGGGYRESHSTPVSGCYTASPLATPTGITVSTTTYPVTVGAGNNSSIFSTITSTNGGPGGNSGNSTSSLGQVGGSGGGGSGYPNAPVPAPYAGGTGNTPPVAPPQGNPGGTGIATPTGNAGGGGGAGGAGGNGTPPSNTGGTGGVGQGTQINPAVGTPGPNGALKYFSGGGGGSSYGGTPGTGGSGGGGNGSKYSPSVLGTNGTANTGGGAGGDNLPGRVGGSGIVIVRYKYQ